MLVDGKAYKTDVAYNKPALARLKVNILQAKFNFLETHPIG